MSSVPRRATLTATSGGDLLMTTRVTRSGSVCVAASAASAAAAASRRSSRSRSRSRSLAAPARDGRPPKFVSYRDSDVDEKTVKFLRVRRTDGN